MNKNESPYLKASFLSRLLYCWLNKFLKKGADVKDEDVYDVLHNESSKYQCDKLERRWNEECKRSKDDKGMLTRALLKTYGLPVLLWSIVFFIQETFKIAQPLLIGKLIEHLTNIRHTSYNDDATLHNLTTTTTTYNTTYMYPSTNTTTYTHPSTYTIAYAYAGGICLCTIVPIFILHHYFLASFKTAMLIRVSCCSLLYKKSLRLNVASASSSTVAQVINLMSNDVSRFDLAISLLPFFIMGPLELIVVTFILWFYLGWGSVVGSLVLLMIVPISGGLARVFSRLRREMRKVLQGGYARGINMTPGFYSGKLIIFAALLCYVLAGNSITAQVVFVAISMYNPARFSMTSCFPMAMQLGAETLVTIRRIQDFLLSDELRMPLKEVDFADAASPPPSSSSPPLPPSSSLLLPPSSSSSTLLPPSSPLLPPLSSSSTLLPPSSPLLPPTSSSPPPPSISATNLTLSWNKSDKALLSGVSFEMAGNELVMVVGEVGVGKTSLLMAILDELTPCFGILRTRGEVAYVSQQAWISNGSIRENILMGSKMDVHRYQEAIYCSCLDQDLSRMAQGDQSRVGERGMGLSGGQKARLGLARALYRRAQVYLLDDPLSAVDADVSMKLFQRCIMGCLKDKLRVLVTHQIQFLPHASKILRLDLQQNHFYGTYDELKAMGVSLRKEESGAIIPPCTAEKFLLSEANDALVGDQSTGSVGDGLASSSPPITASSLPISIDVDIATNTTSSIEHENKSQTTKPNQEKSKDDLDREMKDGGMTDGEVTDVELTDREVTDGQVTDGEVTATAGISARTYYDYLTAGSGVLAFVLLLLLNVVTQATFLITDWWLVYWCKAVESPLRTSSFPFDTSDYAASTPSNHSISPLSSPSSSSSIPHFLTNLSSSSLHFLSTNLSPSLPPSSSLPSSPTPLHNVHTTSFYMAIFTLLSFSVVILAVIRALVAFKLFTTSNQLLHQRMLHTLLRCPIAFFVANPAGRILNRFSKDVGQVDEMLPLFLFDMIQQLFLVVGVFVMLALMNAWVLLAILPIFVVFFLLRRYFLAPFRNVKRIEAKTKGPVFSHINATFQGLLTIRSHKAEHLFLETFQRLQDAHTASFSLLLVLGRWFAIRLECLCSCLIAVVAFAAVFASDRMDAGMVGLSLAYSITLLWLFQWVVRQSTEVENLMTHVERVIEYTKLPIEEHYTSRSSTKSPANKSSKVKRSKHHPDHPPSNNDSSSQPLVLRVDHLDGGVSWPSRGEVEFRGVSLAYKKTGPKVLKDVSFTIKAGEKVGIVGRTGAGKSSLINVIFKLVPYEGSVFIDGLDIGQESTYRVRSSISIIPQDHVIMSGTLRSNLDPDHQHSDHHLWQTLNKVKLDTVFREAGLDQPINESGSNLSIGQQQLLCMGRALLKKNKILLLDEATANVDRQTDSFVQSALREHFSELTVLTVAHRLITVIDCDRIMLMEGGRVVQYGTPHDLLQCREGAFHRLAGHVGGEEMERLRDIALSREKSRKEE